MWRPEARRGQQWKTLEDLDDKRWIVLVERKGGKEGGMEEWDLVGEFFHRVQDPLDEDEDEDGEED